MLTNSNGIILGERLARKLAVELGAKLSVISPAGVIRKMKVVGLFNSGVPEVDSNTSYAMLKKVQILQNRDDVINQVNIRMDDIDAAPMLGSVVIFYFIHWIAAAKCRNDSNRCLSFSNLENNLQ